jgi:biopolymer transport protein ExbB/TolQ
LAFAAALDSPAAWICPVALVFRPTFWFFGRWKGKDLRAMNGNVSSLEKMFLNADPVVQGVMILLFAASLLTWAIIIEKIFVLGGASRQAKRFRRVAQSAQAVDDDLLERLPRLPRQIVGAGLATGRIGLGPESQADFRARVEGSMRLTLSENVERLGRRTLILASIGSTSPFIGLFGTVWGITNSFIGIAATGETTLAVVAPGIAEALFATAMGLVAAIPAVLGYNLAVGYLKKIRGQAVGAISVLGQKMAFWRFQGKRPELNKE